MFFHFALCGANDLFLEKPRTKKQTSKYIVISLRINLNPQTMRNSYLVLVLFVLTLSFSCNQDIELEKATINERGDTDDDAINTLFNQELLFKNKLNGEYLLINVGSNFHQNLSFYINAFDIKVNVDGTSFNDEWGRPQNDSPALRAISLSS